MDILLTPLTDIIKHVVYKNYINSDDHVLNMQLYSLLGITLALISSFLYKYSVKNIFLYMKWHIDYTIFGKKIVFIYPNVLESKYYSPYTIDTYQSLVNYKNMLLFNSDISIFVKTYVKIVENMMSEIEGELTHYKNVYSFDNTKIDLNKIKTIQDLIKNIFLELAIKLTVIAYVDGYYIYLDCHNCNNDKIVFYSASKDALDNFMNDIKNLYNKYSVKDDKNLKVFEAEVGLTKPEQCIGHVKTHLTFDNYISRHKTTILKFLDKFKNEKMAENNIFMDNNLGFLVHGTYGTGKTFLISAIANYLNRSIYNINFAKIKTKSKFREIMSEENVEKYVFCFDEFDYLLTNIIDKNDERAESDVQFKLDMLSKQLVGLKDNKEASEKISDQIKKLMEEGVSDDLTYEFILSELSGITSIKNRIIVATTNFIDKIPKALLRPGRFDVILNLDKFNKDEIIQLLIKLYNPPEKVIKRLHTIKFKENMFTPSEIIINKNYHETLDSMIKFLST
jgi:hypothetical protein